MVHGLTAKEEKLLEEYKQRNAYIRFLGTEQSLVALAPL